jgi:hypothetical protein
MATGAPGTNGVWQYGEDDSEATFSALLNKVASTTNTAIGTDRGRLTTLEARKLSGLVPVIPTGVSINAGSSSYDATTGEITFTGGSVLTANGVFTSAYANYLVIYNVQTTSAATDIYLQLKNSGGTLATGYTNFQIQAASAGVTGGSVAVTTAAIVGRSNGTYGSVCQINLYNPQNTRYKRYNSQTEDALVGRSHFGINGASAQYTDLVIFPNGQNLTDGKCKIYGYN